MAFNPTEMQQKAIETTGNVLVSAAAGSGKTAVLVERVINMLTNEKKKISADSLLIVTFTNAAAAEMHTRIEKRICEEIQKHPDDEFLKKQKYLLVNADICTIDSFCIKLVRENFEKCGISPDFKVGDGSAQQEIANRIMTDLMSEHLANIQEDFERLLELTNCDYDENNLIEQINRIYLYSQQLPFPENFINGLLLPYETKFGKDNVWYNMAFDTADKQIGFIENCIERMYENADYVEKNAEKHKAYTEYVAESIGALRNACDLKDWNGFFALLESTKFKKAPSSNKDDIFAQRFKAEKKKISDIIKKLNNLFYAPINIVQSSINQNYGAVKLFTEIVNEYGKRLFDAFCEKNEFTFYNTEQLALNLLCEFKDGEIVIRDEAQKLCDRYDEVLVDEFQDVNDLQNTLFYVLSNRERKLFAVGDVKQSIYGFRGSNPINFLNKKNKYTLITDASENEPKKIILSDNFRSRKGVCDAVNFYFSHFMTHKFGNIVYNEEERLNAKGEFPQSTATAAELLVIDKYGSEVSESLLELEAEKIAEYIISVMNEGPVISDGKSLRNARYSDFAILLNAVQGKGEIISRCLSEHGIPVDVGGDGFFESFEISLILSLLQVIDNPKCDIELLNVMMSPIFAFSAEEMALIRLNQKYGPLYSAVQSYAKTGNQKTLDFIEKLAEFRRDAAVMSVHRLISKLLYSTDIFNQISAMKGGKQRQANLFLLIKYAQNYDERTNGGIGGFIKYIKSIPEKNLKAVTSGGDDTVKIMTMHSSKGLQFPICIVANLSAQLNKADSSNRVLFSETAGISFKYYDEREQSDRETLGHALMADAARTKTVEEKLRLLYVAMTRAIDRLCLVCSADNLENKLKNLAPLLSKSDVAVTREILEGKNNMGDWILVATLLHPSGEKLIKYSDADVNINCQNHINCDFDLKISIFNDFEKKEINKTQIVKEKANCNFELAEKIKSNAEYVYPYESLRYLQSKASVSSLVNKAETDRFSFSEKPLFMSGEKLSGAAKGTAMHHIMQFIKFDENVDVGSEIERLTEWKFITEQEADSADISAIEKFFSGQLYKRIMKSLGVHREMRFLTETPACELDPDFNTDIPDANVIVQGAIDLCFEEEDGIVVLDFKTDRVNNLSELTDCYAEQLNFYSVAAEKIFSKPVKERIIYSFYLGESISF